MQASNALTMLRLSKETSDIPLIVCTARSHHEVEGSMNQAVVDDVAVIYKPFDLDHLLSAISVALDMRATVGRL